MDLEGFPLRLNTGEEHSVCCQGGGDSKQSEYLVGKYALPQMAMPFWRSEETFVEESNQSKYVGGRREVVLELGAAKDLKGIFLVTLNP